MRLKRTISDEGLGTDVSIIEDADVPDDLRKRFEVVPRLVRISFETALAKITYEQVFE